MKKPTLKKITWSQIKSEFKQHNNELYSAMDTIACYLKEKSYLYEINLPYGWDIIVEGQSSLFDSEIETILDKESSVDYLSYCADFYSNSKQPLSFLLEGVVEVYNSNRYSYGTSGTIKYTYPLAIFEKGALFGTYEAMDYLLDTMKNEHLYSAFSGHRSIYPILPDLNKGSQAYRKLMEPWKEKYKQSNPHSEDNISAMDIFPSILEELSPTMNYTTRIILIPTFWHDKEKTQMLSMNNFLSKKAWEQASKHRIYGEELYSIHEIIKNKIVKKSENVILASQFVQYIEHILQGSSPVLKLNCDSLFAYHKEIEKQMQELLKGTHRFAFFYFDFLQEKEKGILPLLTLPFRLINPDTKVKSTAQFYNEIADVFDTILKRIASGNNVFDGDRLVVERFDLNAWEYMLANQYTKNNPPNGIVNYLSKKFDADNYPYSSGRMTQLLVEITR